MKRILISVAGLALLALAGFQLARALASEDKKIRWRFDEMVEGFNETTLRHCMRGVATEFRDTTSGADRETIKAALVSTFFEHTQAEQGFRYEARIIDLATTVAEEADPASAEIALTVEFLDLWAPAPAVAWKVRVTGRMEKGEAGWQLARTSYETLESDGELMGS